MHRTILSVSLAGVSALLCCLAGSSNARAGAALWPPNPCLAPDNGSGTADFPAACPYVAPQGVFYITNGLPPGTTIQVHPSLESFLGFTRSPGGPLGGETVGCTADLVMTMVGTGGLGGYGRIIHMPVQLTLYASPKVSPNPVQPFDCDLGKLQGQLPPGDPDFDLLRITAGDDFGLPSPGHTTLVRKAPDWNVSSFFDITYRIDFVGHPGGPFSGLSGSTTGKERLHQGDRLWKPGDAYVSHYPQLPNDTGYDVYATAPQTLADDWRAAQTGWVKDFHFWGSWLNDSIGRIKSFDIAVYSDVKAGVDRAYSHPGSQLWKRTLSGFFETPMTDTMLEGWFEPTSGSWGHPNHKRYYQYDIILDSVDWFTQTKDSIYWVLITGNVDPSDTLAGKRWGWKNTLNHFNDDGVLLRAPTLTCVVRDSMGTAHLAASCPYKSESADSMRIIDGLSPGTTVAFPANFDLLYNQQESPGGAGPQQQNFGIHFPMDMYGTGALSGYHRTIPIELVAMTLSTARTSGAPVQSFDQDWQQLQGQLPPGDPDFDLLRITAGTAFGLPSPGHTTLTLQSFSNWAVESFYDLTYRIDFVGHPGGPFSGMSGSTTGTIRIKQGGTSTYDWTELKEPPTFTQSMDLSFVITGAPKGCCIGKRGNVNMIGIVDISDLSLLVAYLTTSPPPVLPCPDEANVNATGIIDISDLSLLVAYLTMSPPPTLPDCP